MKNQSYYAFWENLLPEIKSILKLPPHLGNIRLSADDLKAAGKRADYRFTLEIVNAEKISYSNSSAVARDLVKVFLDDTDIREFADDKYVLLKMVKDFVLHISAMYE